MSQQSPQESQPQELVWWRAHPLSPLVQSWVLLAAVIYSFFNRVFEDFFTGGATFDLNELAQAGPPDVLFLSWAGIFGPFWYLALALAVFLLLLLPFFSRWFFYRFAVDGQNVYIKSGMLIKTERKARLDRVQSIDIKRPLVPRILGLAELNFDVADGKDSALKVQYLGYRQARALREELLAQVRVLKGQASEPGDSALAVTDSQASEGLGQKLSQNILGIQDAQEQLVVKVPIVRLLLSMLLNPQLLLGLLGFLTLLGLAVVWEGVNPLTYLASFAVVFLGVVGALWKRFNTGFNFSLSTSPDGLKTRFGFADTSTQTLPQGRVQRVEVVQPLLWRLTGWYQVKVTLLGKGPGQGDFAGELLPVGTLDEVMRVLPLVLPSQQEGGASAQQLVAGLAGSGEEQGFLVSPAAARFFDPFTYRRQGFALTPLLLLVRSGRWVYRLSLVPHAKIQDLELEQGPMQRGLGLASLTVHVAGEVLATEVKHADAETARALAIRLAQMSLR